MKLKFDTFFRGYIFLLVSILLWAAFAHGETNTNTVTVVQKSRRNDPIIQIPAVFKENKALLTFGLDRVEVLQPELWGKPRWQYVASFLYIVLAFLISKILDLLTRIWLRKWAARTKTRLDDLVVALLHGPVKVIAFVILLHVGLSFFSWPEPVERLLTKGLDLIVVCSVAYMLIKGVDVLMGYWRARVASHEDKSFNEQLFPVVSKSGKVFIFIIAALFICQNVFQQDVRTLIASLSIGGLAIGLAAQDTLANLFGAVAVFIDKPFRIGDFIKLPDAEGVVESIGLRSTRVRNPDGHLITVPNKTMGNSTITNIALRSSIRTVMNFGLTYDTAADKVKRAVDVLNEVYGNHPMTKEVLVSFNRFADSALNIQVIHLWNSTDFKAYLAGMQDLNLRIKSIFDSEKISFAFPSQTVYLRQDSDWHLKNMEELPAGPAR